MPTQTMQGHTLFRDASIVSADPEKRTVDLVWTTGAKGKRRDFWTGEEWYEELAVDESSVRMDRLNSAAPLLDTHGQWSLGDVLGVVERAWIEGGKGMATVRFSSRAEVEPIFQDVKDKIIRNVSVGYRVYKWQDVTENDDKIKTMRAVDWQPMELSLVPVGFDAGAQTRKSEGSPEDTFPMEIISRQGDSTARGTKPMTPEEIAAQAEAKRVADEAAKRASDDAAKRAADEAVENDRKRTSEILTLVRKHQLPETLSARLISEGVSLDGARAQILDALSTRDEQTPTDGKRSRVVPGELDEIKTRREAVESALLNRADAKRFPLSEPGHDYRGMSLLELGRDLLEKRGVNTRGMSKVQLAERALSSTSDFPEILANVANKTLRDAYEAAPQTFQPLVRIVEVPDFKQVSRAQLGEGPALEEVNEHGEFKRGSMKEGAEKYSIKTYGKVIAITRQVLINDDLGAFTRVPMLFGRAAANLESDLVWGVITANAAMGDGTALFHADHDNLAGSGAAIGDTTLTAARTAMRTQKGLDGTTVLNLIPVYIIVPAALETTAAKYLATEMRPGKATDVNPFAGKLQPIVEPRLDADSATKWYVAADVGQVDIIELAYLQGQRGAYTETRMGFEVDGVEVKARLDVGAAVIDYRGLYKNAGA